jgi:hypothetical protein
MRPEMQLQEALQRVVEFLDDAADEYSMASIRINNEGQCYFGVGVHDHQLMTIEELAQIAERGEKG